MQEKKRRQPAEITAAAIKFIQEVKVFTLPDLVEAVAIDHKKARKLLVEIRKVFKIKQLKAPRYMEGAKGMLAATYKFIGEEND